MDSLDRKEVDIYELINELIPNEKGLEQVGTIQYNLEKMIKKNDKQLQLLLKKQLDLANNHKLHMEIAEKEMKLLMDRIEYLRTHSEEAEIAVMDVTKDIKGLDLAKKNLIASITFSKRLQMLVSAVEQLKLSIENRSFIQAGHLMQAVIELFLNFQSFKKIRPIYELGESIHQLQNKLINIILNEFKKSFDENNHIKHSEVQWIKEACSMIEFIHLEGKKNIMDHYLNLQLQTYLNLFKQEEELSYLEHVPQRYHWLKQYLKQYEINEKKIFPKEWIVDELFCRKYCEITSSHLTNQLEMNNDIQLMIKILSFTLQFEQQLDLYFNIKNRNQSIPFYGTISCYFEPYLNRFIEFQDDELNQIIIKYQNQSNELDKESQLKIFESCTQLFLKYQESLNQLSKVSVGKPLLNLSLLFQKYFKRYLELVLKSEEKKIINNYEDLLHAIYLLNTIKYSIDTMNQLEQRLKQDMDTNYVDKIDFEQDIELYNIYLNNTVINIAKGMETLIENGFTMLAKMLWGNWNHLSSNPEYLNCFNSAIKDYSVQIHQELSFKIYYVNICTKFSDAFILRWADTITKLKRLNEIGTRQLLEDGEKIINLLIEMVESKTNNESIIFKNYKKKVMTLYDIKIVKYLELIQFPLQEQDYEIHVINVQKFIDKFMEYASAPQFPIFLRIMEVKNIKRKEQDLLRQELQKRIGLNLDKRASLDSTVENPFSSNLRRIIAFPISRERSSPSN